MLITLTLTSLELDFSGMEEEATPSPEEQAQLNREQLESPIEIELLASETYDGDEILTYAIDEISNRSGWCVAECSFA